MRQNGTRQVFDYWNTLRRGRPAPHRSEIAPAALGRSLAHLFILDAESSPVRFRLAGTWLGTAFGREWTGEPFAALFDRDDRALAGRLVDAVAKEAAIAVIDLHAAAEGDRCADMELVLLPLEDGPARVLGVVYASGNPLWFGGYPLGAARMTGVRLLDPDRPLFNLGNRPTIVRHRTTGQRTAARQTLRVIEGAGDRLARPSAKRPFLRLVRSDRGAPDMP